MGQNTLLDWNSEDELGRNIFHLIAQTKQIECFHALMTRVNPTDRSTTLNIKQLLNKPMD